jgi:NTE family protein
MTPRVVMVLGGGGAKTAAHLGAARALAEAGVAPVHYVGTSLGSVMAAALASGDDPDAILQRMLAVTRHDVVVPNRLGLLRGIWSRSVLKPMPIRHAIADLIPVRRFADLGTPCTITAVDVKTGDEVAFGAGGLDTPLLDALAASCALPPYFPPVRIDGRDYFDGGVRAPVPLRAAEGIACDAVVAIHSGPGFDEAGEPFEVPPPLIALADTAIGWLMADSAQLQRERWTTRPGAPKLIWLRPVVDRGATFALERIPGYAEAGYHAMNAALTELS